MKRESRTDLQAARKLLRFTIQLHGDHIREPRSATHMSQLSMLDDLRELYMLLDEIYNRERRSYE